MHLADHYYHIYYRGCSREPIFANDGNYLFLLRRAKSFLVGYPLSVIAYCLACSTVTPRRSTNGRGAVALCLRGAQRASWLIPTSTSSISVATST